MISKPQNAGEEPSLVFFDGACGLCHWAVRFIAARDPRRRFRFVPLQTPRGHIRCEAVGMDPEQPGSLILEENGQAFIKSEAALRIARHLRFPWPILSVFHLAPRAWRDGAYDAVARRRLRWFGAAERCALQDQADVAERLSE